MSTITMTKQELETNEKKQANPHIPKWRRMPVVDRTIQSLEAKKNSRRGKINKLLKEIEEIEEALRALYTRKV